MGRIEGRNYPWALAINFLFDSIVKETFFRVLNVVVVRQIFDS